MSAVLYQPFPMGGRARGQIWRYAPEFRRPRHFHSEPELNVVTGGNGTFGVGETTVSVSAGDLLWWLPGQDHELLDASPDFDLFVVGLSPELSERVLGSTTAVAHGGPARMRLSSAPLRDLFALCVASPGPGDAVAVESHVGAFWKAAHALRVTLVDRHTVTRRALVSLLGGADIRRGHVALSARTDPSEVSRHFRRNIGLTLTTYRTRLRLLKFIERAADGMHSLLSAALAAGFGSYSQCHRVFQRTLGCSPRAFFLQGARHPMEDAFSPRASRPTPPR